MNTLTYSWRYVLSLVCYTCLDVEAACVETNDRDVWGNICLIRNNRTCLQHYGVSWLKRANCNICHTDIQLGCKCQSYLIFYHLETLLSYTSWRLPTSRDSDCLRTGRMRGRSSSPGRAKNFLSATSSRPALGPTQLPISNGYRELFSRGGVAGAWSWPPTSG
jgi:hypothetical protein